MKSQALSNAQKAFQDQESWVCSTVCDKLILLMKRFALFLPVVRTSVSLWRLSDSEVRFL